MNRFLYSMLTASVALLSLSVVHAGNPDRQGEAGAPELLMNPWARSAGLHTMTTSMVGGVEAMRLNVAGLARITSTEVVFGHTVYLQGTDITMNALGISQRIGNNSAIGISLMSLDFGDIPRTTATQPEGTGATFSPRFFNMGIGYSHIFENKVSVGALVRVVSQGIEDVTATAVALDAGVQYVTGEKENFKFGISLRNIGGRLQFQGEGLSTEMEIPSFDNRHGIITTQRSTAPELQSVLNIGMSYDFYLPANNRFTLVGNYTSNAFSEDNIGGGVEFSFRDLVMLRGGYRFDFGQLSQQGDSATAPLYTGLAGGVTLNVPVNKKEGAPKVALDYAYRTTKIYQGTHNLSVRITL